MILQVRGALREEHGELFVNYDRYQHRCGHARRVASLGAIVTVYCIS